MRWTFILFTFLLFGCTNINDDRIQTFDYNKPMTPFYLLEELEKIETQYDQKYITFVLCWKNEKECVKGHSAYNDLIKNKSMSFIYYHWDIEVFDDSFYFKLKYIEDPYLNKHRNKSNNNEYLLLNKNIKTNHYTKENKEFILLIKKDQNKKP